MRKINLFLRFGPVDDSLVTMSDRKTFSRYNMRCGLILRSNVAGVKLTGFDIPQLDQRFLVITGKDISPKCQLSMFGGSMPLLAINKIDYVGQPLLALFGPDTESVELLIEKISVKTEPLDKLNLERSQDIPSLSFSWGQEEAPTEESLKELKRVDSTFRFEHTTYTTSLRYNVLVWQEGANLHIQAPMQWPELVKNTVETVTGIGKQNIITHQLEYCSKHDEYLMYPALYAALASIATIATNLPVEIRAVGESSRAGIVVTRTTYLNEENKPCAENVKMVIDQGAFGFATEEFQRQAMAGLLPIYSLKSFSADIEVILSNKAPASFCSSLGYSEALATAEYHTSKIAEKAGFTPLLLRDVIERGKTRFTDYAPPYSLEGKDRVTAIAEKAVFNRKWASNTFHKGDFGLLGIIKGIGLASGLGISGFSTTMLQQNDFFSIMSYTAKKNITVNSSAVYTPNITRYWRNIINTRIQDSSLVDSILFLEHNIETPDSGPDVLSRFPFCFTKQLITATKSINPLLKQSKWPLQLKFKAEGGASPCEFEYSGFGALIIELEISKKDYIPIVKEAWGNFSLPSKQLEMETRDAARRTILNTIKECGGSLSNQFKLNLSFVQSIDPVDQFASIISISKALTMSAFANALCQATGEDIATLPTSAFDIERILNGGK